MYQYEGLSLVKGNREIKVIMYEGVRSDHRTPQGERRGCYLCEVKGKLRHIATHNISRYKWKYGYLVIPTGEPIVHYLHAQHALHNQENVIEKKQGLWKRFWKLLTK